MHNISTGRRLDATSKPIETGDLQVTDAMAATQQKILVILVAFTSDNRSDTSQG